MTFVCSAAARGRRLSLRFAAGCCAGALLRVLPMLLRAPEVHPQRQAACDPSVVLAHLIHPLYERVRLRPVSSALQILFFKENINTRFRWWRKARLWRLVLTQSEEGWWDPTEASAFALMASLQPPETKAFARVGLAGAFKAFQTAFDVLMSGGEGDLTGVGPLMVLTKEDARGLAPPAVADPERMDDPLSFHKEAIEYALPIELRSLAENPEAELSLGGAPDSLTWALRVWTTTLALLFLEDHEMSWQSDIDEELTIVDFAQAWLDGQQEANPALRAAMPKVLEKAKRRLAVWRIVQDERITAVRWSCMGLKFTLPNLFLRSAAFVGHAVRIRHEFVSSVLGPIIFEGFRKWQRWVLVWSFLLMALTVEVWCAQRTSGAASACGGGDGTAQLLLPRPQRSGEDRGGGAPPALDAADS